MLNRHTIEKLHALKLIGMAEAFKDQLSQPDIDRLSFEERFGLIVDRQWTWKEDCRMQRYLKLIFYSCQKIVLRLRTDRYPEKVLGTTFCSLTRG